ncbi:hypothetical protein GCK72_014172 [Caenorhabditis remanei]|uniref:PAN-3 domain-containing protein n=1 Tax=Caenorhabditis remanei TaxID=31234 RepID=A0A6A5GT06_CAERE|nr:hypothetical protein GCK72_014172 [Caenorhabditis remanei]KAF1757716.1 hypothetical protein GCK72_014172 [Caenorhabditis remanei]
MSLIPVLVLYFVTSVTSNNSMIVVWGKPTKFFNPTPYLNSTLNWQQCIRECYNFERCVLSFQNSSGCNLYVYNALPAIQKLNSSQGLQVAFKIQNSNDECPVGTNAPTFNNKNASLLWTNTTTGGFQNKSSSTCKSFGGTLPTLNDPTDIGAFTWITELQKGYFKSSQFFVRIDGVRKPACQSNPTTPTCMTPAGFTFTDPHFDGNFDNYNWTTNAGAKVADDDNCLVLVYPNTTTYMKADVKRH